MKAAEDRDDAQSASLGILSSARDIPIRGDIIRLGQLLKLAGVVDSGAEIKGFLDALEVLVNAEPETRRGRQLHPGDVVRVAGQELRVAAAPSL